MAAAFGENCSMPTAALARRERIERRVLRLRGQSVMLDEDLAALYGVRVKTLNQAVKRNRERFPSDFMFRLTAQETASLRSQTVTSKIGRGGRRYAAYAFTEQGVAMLSSVLRSALAIRVNIEIMRAFVTLRRVLESHRDLADKLDELQEKYDEQFAAVFQAIRRLMTPATPARARIGFRVSEPPATR
jgi:ORF6N domain